MLTMTLKNAVAETGLSRSELYRRMSRGELHAVKNSRQTLILADSLRKLIASLPPATFRAPKVAA